MSHLTSLSKYGELFRRESADFDSTKTRDETRLSPERGALCGRVGPG